MTYIEMVIATTKYQHWYYYVEENRISLTSLSHNIVLFVHNLSIPYDDDFEEFVDDFNAECDSHGCAQAQIDIETPHSDSTERMKMTKLIKSKKLEFLLHLYGISMLEPIQEAHNNYLEHTSYENLLKLSMLIKLELINIHRNQRFSSITQRFNEL